ncbi:MAG: hypothetical protein AAF389_06080 [Gemmatimonadota bacterium]
MRALATALVCLVLSGAGCAHHNVVRNASALFADAEAQRRLGDHEEAGAFYGDVVRKAGEALRARPDSEWAEDAQLLLGQAHFRLGNLRAARAALRELSASEQGIVGPHAGVYLALIHEAMGNRGESLAGVQDALEGDLADDVRAEAHLLRARLLLQRGSVDLAWWDLDRAIEAHRAVRVDAALIGLDGAIDSGDDARAETALGRLFGYREGGERVREVETRIETSMDVWGVEGAVALASLIRRSSWPRAAEGRVHLLRARLLHDMGETQEARRIAEDLRSGRDQNATEARLLMSAWDTWLLRDLAGLASARRDLLVTASERGAADRLAAIDAIDAFAAAGLDDPLAWFAAGEIARDRLGAPYLARGLFLAYADATRDEPWVPKALLAALDVSAEAGDRAWLRGRLEAYASSPYVVAAQGGSAAGLAELEDALDARLEEVTQR